MKSYLRFLRRIYGLLLNLFSRAYREEYGDELQAVFDLSLEDAAKAGRFEVVKVFLRELVALSAAIIHEHLRKPKYGLVTQPSIFEKGSYMEIKQKFEWEELGSWKATIASLLPLWLFFFAIANISVSSLEILEIIALYIVLPVSIVLLWKGWMTFDLLLYSFLPMFIQFFLDDIDSNCKLLLKLLCTLTLTLGIVGYQRSLNKDSVTLAWLSLLLAAITAWIFVSHAVQNFCG